MNPSHQYNASFANGTHCAIDVKFSWTMLAIDRGGTSGGIAYLLTETWVHRVTSGQSPNKAMDKESRL